jgi:tight adherence protein C
MYLILILGLALVGVAAALAIRALGYGRLQASARIRSIEMYGFRSAADTDEAPMEGLDLRRVAEALGRAMIARFPGLDAAQIRRELLGAGYYTVTPATYVGYRALATAGLTALLAFLAVTAPSVYSVIGFGVGVTLGWRIPRVILQRRAKERYEQIDRDLPELIDLLVVSIEAGVGLGGALHMIALRMTGPLGDELRLMLQEQSMGLSNDQSLSKLLDRVDTPSVRSFVRSLQQGERLGVSIGTILRNLAIEMRTRRRQLAEERAQKAPVKILFPLVFMIFPSMFIVLLGPAVFKVKEIFG